MFPGCLGSAVPAANLLKINLLFTTDLGKEFRKKRGPAAEMRSQLPHPLGLSFLSGAVIRNPQAEQDFRVFGIGASRLFQVVELRIHIIAKKKLGFLPIQRRPRH